MIRAPARCRPDTPLLTACGDGAWSIADRQQWRDMGSPTMVEALARIRSLEARIENLEAELLATPLPAPDAKMLARKAKRKRGGQ